MTKIEFDVKMTKDIMYDYMMYHTFTMPQFYLTVAVGLMSCAVFFVNRNAMYIIIGLIVIGYLPVERYMQAARQVIANPVFKEDLHYTLTDEGMALDVLEEHMDAKWDMVVKVRSTKKSLFLYTNGMSATIFPREALGEDYDEAVRIIRNGVPKERVRIR